MSDASNDIAKKGERTLEDKLREKPVLPRKFFKKAEPAAVEGGFQLLLDGKPAKTPARMTLFTHDGKVMEAVAQEWNALVDVIDPAKLPVTKLINVALDRVAANTQAVLDEVAAYGASDLLCYRAETPQGLVERQNETWGAFLLDLYRVHRVRMEVASGIIAVEQKEEALTRLRHAIEKTVRGDSLRLAALSVATTLTGSVILALALAEGREKGDVIWQAAHLDEDWNIEHWGRDGEAEARRAARKRDFDAAALVLLG